MNHLLHKIWMLLIAALVGTVLVAVPGSPVAAVGFGDLEVTVTDGGVQVADLGIRVAGSDNPVASDASAPTTLSGLPAGPVDIEIIDDWYSVLGTGTATIVDGGVAALTIPVTVPTRVGAEITVNDMSGNPLDGLEVHVHDTTPADYEWRTFNPSSVLGFTSGGIATLSGIPTGDRQLTVYRSDTFGTTQVYAGPILIAADPTMMTVQIDAIDTGSAMVTVTDGSGAPLKGVNVRRTLDGENPPAQLTGASYRITDQNGEAPWLGMPGGVYTFEHTDDGGNIIATDSVNVVEGTPATAALTVPTGSVDVTVEDTSSAPLQGYWVSDQYRVASAATASTGIAPLAGVPVGERNINVYDQFGQYLDSTPVTIVAGSPAQASIQVTPPTYGALEVTVKDSSGTPLPGYRVKSVWSQFPVPGYVYDIVTDGTGVALLDPMPLGAQDVLVQNDNPYFSTNVMATVTAGPLTKLDVVGLDAPSIVDVTVLDQNGAPVPNARARLAGAIGFYVGDNLGHVMVGQVGPALPPGPGTIEVLDIDGKVVGTAPVTVVDGATVAVTVNATYPARVPLTLTILDETNAPLPWEVFDFVGDRFFTGANGTASIPAVPVGDQEIVVFYNRKTVHTETLVVTASTTAATVQVTRPGFGDATINVVDVGAAPVLDTTLRISVDNPDIPYEGPVGYDVPSGSGGVTTQTAMIAGDYLVEVLDQFGNVIGSKVITVTAGGLTDVDITVTPVPTGTLEITVLDSSTTNPVDGVKVVIDSAVSKITGAAGSAGTATFVVPQGPRGISVQDAFGRQIGYGFDTVVAGSTTPVTLHVQAPQYGSLRLNIHDSNLLAVPGLRVRAVPTGALGCDLFTCSPVTFHDITTGSSGFIEFDPMPVGSEHVIIALPNGTVVYSQPSTITAGNQTVTDVVIDIGSLEVTVDDGTNPVMGLRVEAAPQGSTLAPFVAMTGIDGKAKFPTVLAGSLDLKIISVGGTQLATRATTVANGALTVEDFTVTVPPTVPPLSTLTATTASIVTNPETGRSTISMTNGGRSDLTIAADAMCASGVPTGVTLWAGFGTYPMAVVGAGPTYSVTIPAASVGSGSMVLHISCAGEPDQLVDLGEIVLYDPSGFVTDENTGDPVVGAQVRLYNVPGWSPRLSDADNGIAKTCETNESKPPSAAWSQPAPVTLGVLEPIGSGRMSPNVNPFITDSVGHYGWDVAKGCWYVTVDAPGYESYVSPVVGVPSEVTDLDIALTPIVVPTIPGAPTAVSATVSKAVGSPAVGSAQVKWTAPTSDGNSAITGYTATVLPGGATCTSVSTSCSISGLAPGGYTVSVTATNGVGVSPASVSVAVTVVPPVVVPPVGVTPVTPARLLDTRPAAVDIKTVDGKFLGLGRSGKGKVVEFDVAGRGGVGADAAAVFLNVVAVGPSGPGYLMVFACDARPGKDTANVNYNGGDVIGNAVLSKISAAGKVCIFSWADTDLVVDVNGYVPVGGPVNAVEPARLVETRSGSTDFQTVDGDFLGGGQIGAGKIYEFQVRGRGGVAASASAVFLNVVTVAPTGPGFATVFPCDVDKPNAANVNYNGGDVIGNSVLSDISADGKVCVFTWAATDLVVDVNGFVEGEGVKGVAPARLLETRPAAVDIETVDGKFLGGGRSGMGKVVEFEVTGRGGVDADAAAVFLNVVAVGPSGPGYLMVFACGSRPAEDAANVNYNGGDVIGNAVVSKVGVDGKVCIFSWADTDLVVDVNGFVPG